MKIQQNGRSMVEMLGVLAIIGVLSAGALAGYSKAMFRHRVNQTIEIFQGVLQRFAELEQKDWGNVEIFGWEDMIKYNLMPSCQKAADINRGAYGCKLPIGMIGMDFCNSCPSYADGAVGAFWIDFTSSKECIAFTSVGWEKMVPVEWFNPGGFISVESKILYDPNGIRGSKITEVSMADVIEGCKICDERELCEFSLIIRAEY